jgi:hypothetical protein
VVIFESEGGSLSLETDMCHQIFCYVLPAGVGLISDMGLFLSIFLFCFSQRESAPMQILSHIGVGSRCENKTKIKSALILVVKKTKNLSCGSGKIFLAATKRYVAILA